MAPTGPITEVAILDLKPGVDLEDESSPAYQLSREVFSVISSQEGFQRAYYGHHLEDLSKLDHVIDWDSCESHKRFMETPEYAHFLENFGTILSTTPKLFHFQPGPFPPFILSSAPCTEVAIFFKTVDGYLGVVEKFMECVIWAEGYLGHSFGEVVEEIEKREGEGVGKAVLLYIGWTSKEAHLKFKETEIFKKNVAMLGEGMGGLEQYHVAFRSQDAS